MPTSSEVAEAAANFIQDTVTADAKINGVAGYVTDRHGTVTKNLQKILAELEGMGAAMYDSEAIGLANTSPGDLFLVKGTGEIFARLYKNVAGSAVFQDLEQYSAEALDNLKADIAAQDLENSTKFSKLLNATAVTEPFETTRADIDRLILDPDGRVVTFVPAGFDYQEVLRHQYFETTRDDIQRLVLDPDGRIVRIEFWATRLEQFETTRDISRIRLDLGGREIADPDVTLQEIATARGDRLYLDDRLSVQLDAYGASTDPFYGSWALREYRMRSRNLLMGNTTPLVIAIIGDSYTQKYDRYVGPVTERLWEDFGFAGCGYQSFGWFGDPGGPWVLGGLQPVGSDSASPRGSPFVQTQYSGDWTTAYNSPASGMPSISRTSSSTVGALLQIAVTKTGHDECVLFYYGTGSGQIEVSWNDGASYGAPISLTGTGPQFVTLTGIPATAFTMRLRVASGSVSLGGLDFRSSAPGIRVHRLGGSGSRASQWATAHVDWASMIEELAPNVLVVAHGTNDQGSGDSPSVFQSNVLTIVNAVLGVAPSCDVLLTTPPENNRETNSVQMTEYAIVERQLAVQRNWAHLNYQQFFGSPDNFGAEYAAANANRPWFNADLVHPEPAYPVMADALLRFFNN